MQVVVKNLDVIPRQFQYYGRNQFIILEPHQRLIIDPINDKDDAEVLYYESLRKDNFSVCFHHEDDSCADCDQKRSRVIKKGHHCDCDLED